MSLRPPQQKAVFITGAAAGIGRATALTFARKGFTVGGYDIDEVGLKTLADEMDQLGSKAIVGHLDVTDADEMAQRVAEFAKAAGDRLDVLINNAGILRAGRFEELDVGGHFKEIDINAKGVVNGLHAAFPHLKSTPGSVVVNLASASAIYGQAELANYSATKFFVRGITEALDIEWNRYGIRVIAMWPLYVQTAMTDNIKTGTTDSLGIRLTAQDVADAIAAAVEPSWWRRAVHQVHFPVGSQTKAMADRLPVLTRLADAAGQQAIGALLMFKMTVEDVFVIRNRGVVATGRIEAGTLSVGDLVNINGGPGVRVDAIEQFRKQRDEATVGENVGVLIKSIDKGQLNRGDVLTSSSSSSSYGEAPPI